jgi:mannosylglycerate hydrolase MGH1-like protein
MDDIHFVECVINLNSPAGESGRTEGQVQVPCAGTLVIELVSPRPLRLWIGNLQVIDEDIWWRRFERYLRMIVTLPIDVGVHHLYGVYGPRPVWPSILDMQCPSRNREHVRHQLHERFPDRFALTAVVEPGAFAVAASLRIMSAQCVISGVVFQHVLARILTAPRLELPGIDCDRPDSRPRWQLALRSDLAPYCAKEASDAADRAAGVQRCLVPIATRSDPLPLARNEEEVDDRVEPECTVVAKRRLMIEPVLATAPEEPVTSSSEALARPIVAELAVHESRGRLASVREHRELRWPSEDELLRHVPSPIMPAGARDFARLHEHAWRMLLRLRRVVDPRSGLPNDYVGAARDGFPHQMFVWDCSFTALCTAWGWRTFPYGATLDCLYSRQMDGGYLHREFDVREGTAICWEPDFSPNPPISVIAEWKIAGLTGDTARLAAIYPVLSAQHAWIRHNRRLPDGTYWTTGLANGLDNSPSLGDGYPDLTAQQAHAAEILGRIATVLGLSQEAKSWEAERREIGRAMNAHLWSDNLRFFSTSLLGGGHNTNKIITGFWPLWTGLVPPDRVSHCARHLLDPNSFWRHHPIPSLAADSPSYCPDGDYWLGSTWAPTNAVTAWAFARASRYDLARRIVLRHLEVMLEVYRATGCIWENYCAERSAPGSWSMPDHAFPALGPTALLYEILIGVRTDALQQRIRWILPEAPGWGLRRIPLGAATIDLCLLEERHIDVANDRPFILELEEEARIRRRRFPPGRWRLPIDEVPIASPGEAVEELET